jgi:pyruvate dehydrogenase E1 component
MTATDSRAGELTPPDYEVLRGIEQRVLWLATCIVDHANRVRPNPSGMKVGGHQASSASITTIMTSLWFRHLGRRTGYRSSRTPPRCCTPSSTCSVSSTWTG